MGAAGGPSAAGRSLSLDLASVPPPLPSFPVFFVRTATVGRSSAAGGGRLGRGRRGEVRKERRGEVGGQHVPGAHGLDHVRVDRVRDHLELERAPEGVLDGQSDLLDAEERPGHQAHRGHGAPAHVPRQGERQREHPQAQEAVRVPRVGQGHGRLHQPLAGADRVRQAVDQGQQRQPLARGPGGRVLHALDHLGDLVHQAQRPVAGAAQLEVVLRLQEVLGAVRLLAALQVLLQHDGEGADQVGHALAPRVAQLLGVQREVARQRARAVQHLLPDLPALPEPVVGRVRAEHQQQAQRAGYEGVRLGAERGHRREGVQRRRHDAGPPHGHQQRLPDALDQQAAGDGAQVVEPVLGGVPLGLGDAQELLSPHSGAEGHLVVLQPADS
mmetsp:Transcript_7280/g.11208  ORF Transcript_7280/g.11208 Transcript_7280/m.11208 type:complete len:385 (+) Transcript_7280:330-1484(+)